MILYCPKCKEYMAWAGHADPGHEPLHGDGGCFTKTESCEDPMPEPEKKDCLRCGVAMYYWGGRQLCWKCRKL